MSNISKKIQKNAENFTLEQFFSSMTPEQYKEGISQAIRKTEEKLTKEYKSELIHIQSQYNDLIRKNTLIAMDTLATEMVYELGNVLECYKDDPEYLDQKVEIVQGIYETAMKNIEDYASPKYKTDKQAQKEFERKKKTIQKVFGMKAK